MMKKSKSTYELDKHAPVQNFKYKNPLKYQSSSNLAIKDDHGYVNRSKSNNNNNNIINNSSNNVNSNGKHKVVIYFSDAYNNIGNNKTNGAHSNNDNNIDHANRSVAPKDFMAQLKTVLEEKSKFTNKFADSNASKQSNNNIEGNGKDFDHQQSLKNKFLMKPTVPEKPEKMRFQINQASEQNEQKTSLQQQLPKQRELHNRNLEEQINEKSSKQLLPSFIESIDENNVIKLKIEQNFQKASELVNLISSLPKKKKQQQQQQQLKNKKMRKSDTSNETSSIHELNFSHEEEVDNVDELDDSENDEKYYSEPDEEFFYDWSFVQQWRSR
jgi:hypothetical protein